MTITNDFSDNRGMNVIFLTMSNMHGVESRGIYSDLMRKFRDCGHKVYIASPLERRLVQGSKKFKIQGSELLEVDGVTILKVRTLNLQKTNVIEKGAGQMLVESQFKSAIKRHLGSVAFDLILYSTPPITLIKVIEYLKRQNPQAMTYLLLKDIFPQNAVDLGMMPGASFKFQISSFKSWVDLVKCLLYKMFRNKEKRLYALSDYIGCMSPANVRYVIEHNPEVDPKKVEVAPNSIEANPKPLPQRRGDVREKYGLPKDKPIFIYGGNLGKPQGIPFLIKCLEANAHRVDCHFVVIGTGTELPKLQEWYRSLRSKSEENLNQNHQEFENRRQTERHQVCLNDRGAKEEDEVNLRISTSKDAKNSKLSSLTSKLSITVMEGLPKEEYDELVRSCDVGLIFLDHRFTIPNYPSRLLSYLENKMPVICATDPNTDMGRIAEENGYGYWCESVRPEDFTALVDKMLQSDRKEMGQRGYEFLQQNYSVENTYQVIIKHVVK